MHTESRLTLSQASITALSTATNSLLALGTSVRTFRTYVKPREYGSLKLKMWHSNAVDSTWDDGKDSKGSDLGGSWSIEACYIADGGTDPDGGIDCMVQVPVTYNGWVTREVMPGECFWSDEVEINLHEGHYLVISWAIKMKTEADRLPFNTETLLASAYEAEGNVAHYRDADEFTYTENKLVLPALITYEKQVKKNIVFIGDSITQGVRNELNAEEYWSAKIAAGLGTSYGVWNIGSGWARAYDLEGDSCWLNKAMMGDEVIICLGVNDIGTANRSGDQVLAALTYAIQRLKRSNPDVSIILFTVPPFNFEQEQEKHWRYVNQVIREAPPAGVDRVFDIAAVLGLPAPMDRMVNPLYMSNKDDPHPNGLAGTAVAEAFLAWYRA